MAHWMSFWQNKPPAQTRYLKGTYGSLEPEGWGSHASTYSRVPNTVQWSLLTVHVPSTRNRIQHTASLASIEGAFELCHSRTLLYCVDFKVVLDMPRRSRKFWGHRKLATLQCRVLTVDEHRLESHDSVQSMASSFVHCFTKRHCTSMVTRSPEFVFL